MISNDNATIDNGDATVRRPCHLRVPQDTTHSWFSGHVQTVKDFKKVRPLPHLQLQGGGGEGVYKCTPWDI